MYCILSSNTLNTPATQDHDNLWRNCREMTMCHLLPKLSTANLLHGVLLVAWILMMIETNDCAISEAHNPSRMEPYYGLLAISKASQCEIYLRDQTTLAITSKSLYITRLNMHGCPVFSIHLLYRLNLKIPGAFCLRTEKQVQYQYNTFG